MSEWQPIETAPKDGQEILLFCRDTREQMVGFWSASWEGWQFAHGPYDGPHICIPDDWRPLPEPPEGMR